MSQSPAPKWFWSLSALALVWNLLGVGAFFARMTLDLGALPAGQRVFYELIPVWATAAFATAVFAGALGCVALLLRKTWASVLFALSLLGIVVQVAHSHLLADGFEVFGTAGLVMPTLTIGIAIALLILAKHSTTRGWLS